MMSGLSRCEPFRRPRRGLAALLLLLAGCGSVTPGGITASWSERGQEAEALLRQGEAEAALAITSRVVDEMVRDLRPSPASDRALSSVLTLHAVAEAALGREDAAVRHWWLAQALDPRLEAEALASYGAAGAFLAERPLPDRSRSADEGCAIEELDGRPVFRVGDSGVGPPGRRSSPQPELPRGTRASTRGGRVEIQAVIDEEGRVHRPLVVHSDAAPMAYSAVEAVAGWRFEPARAGGEPVAVCYNLTINWSVRRSSTYLP